MLPLVLSVGILALIGCIRTQTGSGDHFMLMDPLPSMVDNVVVLKVLHGDTTGYNKDTGKYTCKIPGIYSFSANYEYNFDYPKPSCKIRKNSEDLVPIVSHGDYKYAYAIVNVSLATGDTVYVGNCVDWNDIIKYTFTFKGGLRKEIYK